MHMQKTKKEQRCDEKSTRLPEGSFETGAETQALNHEHEKLLKWFQTVEFRKVLIGGVDEAHLFKKLEELNQIYDSVISAERARYDALLEAHTKASSYLPYKYNQELIKRSSGKKNGAAKKELSPGGEEQR